MTFQLKTEEYVAKYSICSPATIVILGIVLVVLYVLKCSFFGPLRHVPGPWWSHYTQLPDFYHLFTGDRALYIHSLHGKYGDTIRVGPNLVGVSGIAALKTVYGTGLVKPFSRDPAITQMFNFLRTADGDNIASFHLPADASRRRREYGNVFSRGNVLGMQDTYKKCFENFLAKLEAGRKSSPTGIVAMVKCFRALALDVITEASFGGFYKGGDDPDYQMKLLDNVMSANLVHLNLGGFLYRLVLRIPWKRLEWVHAKEQWCEISVKATSEYLANRKANPSAVRKDVIGQLLTHNLPQATIESEALANIFAGTDTTGNSTAFISTEILKHPEVHAKLVEELDRVFSGSEYKLFSVMDYAKVEECHYLRWCIREGLRRHSLAPGPALRLVPDGGSTINGYDIPEKVAIFVQSETANHDPTVFPNPHQYDPDRWARETPAMRTLFATFGSGPRICPGENLAMMEMQMMLALMFRNYKVSAPPGCDMEITEFWLRAMKCGELWLKLEPRGPFI